MNQFIRFLHQPILPALIVLLHLAVPARAGNLRGVVTDLETKEPLTGANLILEGTPRGAATDLDGLYVIFNIKPGSYTLKVTMLGYESAILEGVNIGDAITVLPVFLRSSAIKLEEVVVTAGAPNGSSQAELDRRLENTVLTDAISQEVLKRLPDPDVANVVRRTTGVSVDKGDPVIRGLGVRYSKVTLNNAALAGTEPNRSAVSLSLFPASLMSGVTVSKSYMPDQSGEFGGGTVNMQTFNLPSNLKLEVSASSSYNSRTTFKSFKTYDGGGLDWIGYDDGSRAVPEIVGSATRKIKDGNYTRTELQAFGQSFSNNWEPYETTATPNRNVSVSIGNRALLFGRHFQYVVSGLYGYGFETRENAVRIINKNGTLPGEVLEQHTYTYDLYTRNVNLGAMAAMKYQVSERSNLNFNLLFSRDANDATREFRGYNEDRATEMSATRLYFTGETTATGQLIGNHVLPGILNSTVDWQVSYSRGTRTEPDRREVQYELTPAGEWIYADETYSGARIFSDLHDDTYSGSLNWLVKPFGASSQAELKTGVSFMTKEREFTFHRYEYEKSNNAIFDTEFLTQSPNDLFAKENIHFLGWELTEYTRNNDSYTASQQLGAGYVMGSMPLSQRLFLSGGVRYEQSIQEVTSFEPFVPTTANQVKSGVETGDFLPALSVRYILKPRMNLRFAASQTVSRPDFREMSEFEFQDFIGGQAVKGNPNLTRALIRNYDVRWELVHGVADLMAFSVFYKNFTNPIEMVIENTAQQRLSYENALGANNYGVEIELRQNLGLLWDPLRTMTVTTNLSLIESDIVLRDDIVTNIQTSSERPLAGQSPYLFNLGINYLLPATLTQINFFYHTFGSRIASVGSAGLPDIYELPHHDLDLGIRHPINQTVSFKAGISNILDSQIRFEQAGKVTESYYKGRSVSIGFSYSH